MVGSYPTIYLIHRRPFLTQTHQQQVRPYELPPFQDWEPTAYCPQFPEVIRLVRVGCPRVTELFARSLAGS